MWMRSSIQPAWGTAVAVACRSRPFKSASVARLAEPERPSRPATAADVQASLTRIVVQIAQHNVIVVHTAEANIVQRVPNCRLEIALFQFAPCGYTPELTKSREFYEQV
jgi:hypothetical protein